MSTVKRVQVNGPEITIFKDWHIGERLRWTSSADSFPEPTSNSHSGRKSTGRSRPSQKFAFVNTTHVGKNKDPDTRKFVRTHVRNDYLRKRQSTSKSVRKSTNSHRPSQPAAVPVTDLSCYDTLVIEDAIGLPTALSLSPWPLDMSPKMHQLLSRYLTHVSASMYPLSEYLSSNPIRSPAWFHFAVQDPLMLQGVMYAGAIYLTLLEGRRDSEESVVFLGGAIQMLEERLRSGGADDGVLAALSCVALGEANTGHLDQWHIHMRGIQQLISTRGTISSLPPIIQTKLRRSDITGALDYAAVPYLPYERPCTQITISRILPPPIISTITSSISSAFSPHGIHPKLIAIMQNVALFAQSIKYASNSALRFDPLEFSDDIYWIEYQLLTFPSYQESEPSIEKATRMGGLLFMKSILQEFPHSTTGPEILLRELRDAVSAVEEDEDEDEEDPNRQWLLWLYAIGALLAKGMTREWFVGRLAGGWYAREGEGEVEGDVVGGQLWRLLDLGEVLGEREVLLLWDEVEVEVEVRRLQLQ
ncbi:Fungal specific transcription factor domain-containing protein [Rutstroemia sp. NJR-2017a BBW]|nr:Fungal specific transcription factor domain-containing protein [Rutstroemia sp. NJR-2017a BBW]